jgi:hypothetical protein
MANETNSNLTPEQMAARIAELEGRVAALASNCLRKGCFGIRARSLPDHSLPGAIDALWPAPQLTRSYR